MSKQRSNGSAPGADVPPTEPIAAPTPLDAATTTATMDETVTRIVGSDLVPDIERHRTALSKVAYYWIGALPGLPVENVSIGGETFPKMEERVINMPGGTTQRSPLIGALVPLTADKVALIRDRLRQTVVRFTDEDDGGLGVGKTVEAAIGDQKRRRGFLITIPSDAEMAERRKNQLPENRYVPDIRDEPVAKYLFAQLCPDQDRPGRGEHYPPPMIETGIQWPGSLT